MFQDSSCKILRTTCVKWRNTFKGLSFVARSLKSQHRRAFEFHWCKEPVRALGILNSHGSPSLWWAPDSHYQKQNEGKNLKEKVDKLNTVVVIWQSRSTTLFGRVLITKCLEFRSWCTQFRFVTHVAPFFLSSFGKKADKTGRKVMSPDYLTEVCVGQTLS